MICIIAAVSRNGVIGSNGRIPWKIPGEQKLFRQLTTGNVVVMGRRTYEEIGRPLPDRLNIVVSSTRNFSGENLVTATNLSDAIRLAGEKDIFISGGRQLYKEALSLADRLYITEVDLTVEGDTFFPEFDPELYNREILAHCDGEIPYTYVLYTKKNQ